MLHDPLMKAASDTFSYAFDKYSVSLGISNCQHLGETSPIKDTFKHPGFQLCTEGPATTDVSWATRSPRAITVPATVCVSVVAIFPTPKNRDASSDKPQGT